MSSISIFNDVLGPVMRGPSSSHTAGSFHIARLLRDLLGTTARRAHFTFDPHGSYAQVFREQGVDRGFAMGLLGWPLTDARFFRVLDLAPAEGLDLQFEVRPLEQADHPNTVAIELEAAAGVRQPDLRSSALRHAQGAVSLSNGESSDLRTARLRAIARSIGGGSVEIVSIDGWPVRLTGETYELVVRVEQANASGAADVLSRDGEVVGDIRSVDRGSVRLLHARRNAALPDAARASLERLAIESTVREARPVAFLKRGHPLFASAGEMIALAAAQSVSLGRLALAHEASLVGIGDDEVLAEMTRRLDVMSRSVDEGLAAQAAPDQPAMQLLEPSARAVFEAEAAGRVAIGGLHTRAAARALAAMHVNSQMGVVCAAPTGGSAGVLPGVMTTLMESPAAQRSGFGGGALSLAGKPEAAALALFAAGAIGIVVAARATFAAEVAGCQVEIGAAGAMAAAAVVEASGGSAAQAADAAAIAFQNTMGSVCDLVQGVVEIPCHTRNAVAASSAFVCADLVLGGYRNPIPLDDTIDAVLAVGRMLPAELRCTARGGLAATPAALALKRRKPV